MGDGVSETNLLIDRMPVEIRSEIFDAGVEMSLPAGQSLGGDCLAGSHVYVITSGIASKVHVSANGRISGIGMVGHEGLFPTCALMAVPGAPHLVIGLTGEVVARKIRTKEFQSIIRESDEARQLLRKFIYAFMTQVASNMLCAEQHEIRAKLARWLLMCHDRVSGDDIHVTHDVLAHMAFAYRPTVTNALAAMKDDGLIDTSRGCVTILSRAGLTKLSASSYGMPERYWQKHIGPFGKDDLS